MNTVGSVPLCTPLTLGNEKNNSENILYFARFDYLCRQKRKERKNMEAIVDRTSRTVTVRMSTRRWNRMLELEQTYKLARL
jgi:hypothetical protein